MPARADEDKDGGSGAKKTAPSDSGSDLGGN